jgi:hypothetical protein
MAAPKGHNNRSLLSEKGPGLPVRDDEIDLS